MSVPWVLPFCPPPLGPRGGSSANDWLCDSNIYTRFTHAFSHLFQGLQTFHEVHQNGEKMPPIPSRVLGSERSFLLPACLLALVTAFSCPFSNSQLDLPQCPVFFLLLLTEPAGM